MLNIPSAFSPSEGIYTFCPSASLSARFIPDKYASSLLPPANSNAWYTLVPAGTWYTPGLITAPHICTYISVLLSSFVESSDESKCESASSEVLITLSVTTSSILSSAFPPLIIVETLYTVPARIIKVIVAIILILSQLLLSLSIVLSFIMFPRLFS